MSTLQGPLSDSRPHKRPGDTAHVIEKPSNDHMRVVGSSLPDPSAGFSGAVDLTRRAVSRRQKSPSDFARLVREVAALATVLDVHS